jgi:hypothetical protein
MPSKLKLEDIIASIINTEYGTENLIAKKFL